MKPVFEITDRDNKKALWVKTESELLNIYDLPESELTETVKKAIISAFYRGAYLQRQALLLNYIEGHGDNNFVENTKKR
jgi:hypothetical protein